MGRSGDGKRNILWGWLNQKQINKPFSLKHFLLPKLNFTQFLKRNVKIQGRRLYPPSLKDVALLEVAQFIFLIFHTFVCKFG